MAPDQSRRLYGPKTKWEVVQLHLPAVIGGAALGSTTYPGCLISFALAFGSPLSSAWFAWVGIGFAVFCWNIFSFDGRYERVMAARRRRLGIKPAVEPEVAKSGA